MSELTWRWTKPLDSDEVVFSFEKFLKYEFPESFLECVLENNGGRPNRSLFKTSDGHVRAIKRLLSFDSLDKESIWKLNDVCYLCFDNRYVAFAIDHFGNLICFDKSNDHVKFIETESLEVSDIADNFDEFLSILYETSSTENDE